MTDVQFSFRQVHLDFHTAPQAPDVGTDFDPDEFVETLREARVGSITCFSRCHHGMIYHETKFPARHPNLKRNLLAEQIEACHKAGIRVPVYITVGWDMYQWQADPSIAQISSDGKTIRGAGTLEPGWVFLCFNSRYIDYVVEQTMEVLDLFEVDGLFFDIIHHDCCCPRCVDLMRRKGLDPHRPDDRYRFNAETLDRFKQRMTTTVRGKNRDCTIFYNAGHIDYRIRSSQQYYTHFELESLPGGGWGYDHFPITGRYARRLKRHWLMMTGRFHTTWGDFGSYKVGPALEYECLRAIAMGGACSVGDQLHPRGRLEPVTFDLIGRAYRRIERIEPFVADAEPVVEAAIVWAGSGAESNEDSENPVAERLTSADRGAFRMCLEEHLFFDFVDPETDLNRYRLLILPDTVAIDEAFAEKLKHFLSSAGTIICSWESGLRPDGSQFALPLGLDIEGPAPVVPEYIRAEGKFLTDLPDVPIVMYETGLAVRPNDDLDILAQTYRPYFNREAGRFCSHRHWPAQGPAGRPAVVRCGQIIYFAHPIFRAYANYAVKHYRQMVANAIDLLLPQRILRSNLPSTAQVELLASDERTVMAILHYVPEHRSPTIPTIEEPLPLIDIELQLRTPRPVTDVSAILPEGEQDIRWSASNGSVSVSIPKMVGKLFIELKH